MKPIRFFCEFCGHEVRASDKFCKHCGSFFSQVRCQNCNFQGDYKLFVKGCPVCGYVAQDPSKLDAASKTAKPLDSKSKGTLEIPWPVEELEGKKKQKDPPKVPGWFLGLGIFLVLFLMFSAYLISNLS